MKRTLCDELPSTLDCRSCGEEFDTDGLKCRTEKQDGAEWIVVRCPHCGEKVSYFRRELNGGYIDRFGDSITG